MRHFLVLFICFISILNLTGCQEEKKQEDKLQDGKYIMTPGKVEVEVIGGGEFPEELVGEWNSKEDQGWKFIFESDGRISVAQIAMGRTKIIPGEITTLPTLGGGEAKYIPGNWLVTYDPGIRELTVDVVMNYIRVEMGEKALVGKAEDVIIGTVSEDGKEWNTIVHSFPEYEGFPNKPGALPYTNGVVFEKSIVTE